MSKLWPSRLPPVRPWASHVTLSVPQILPLQKREDNSIYSLGLVSWSWLTWINIRVWHIIHIFALSSEFWSHQTLPNSLNMKLPRPGKANISIVTHRGLQDFLAVQWHRRRAALTPSIPLVWIRTRLPTRPETSLLDHFFFHHLNDLDSQKLLPQGNEDAKSWWEKSKLSNGHLEHLTFWLLIIFPVIYTAESEVPGEWGNSRGTWGRGKS